MRIETSRGLKLHPISQAALLSEAIVPRVAFVGADHPGLRVEVLVERGQSVSVGTALCRDRRRHDICFTASVSGTVSEIVTGPKRHVTAIVIAAEGDERLEFDHAASDAEAIRTLMLTSGLWPALRTRPFDRIPSPENYPDAIFITAIDTAPQAADPNAVLAERGDDFSNGVAALALLTSGPVYVCQDAAEPMVYETEQIKPVRFVGPHPAGQVGTHIARLFPLRDKRQVWHINYQDAAALGALIKTGRPDPLRTIAVGGPGVRNPSLVRVPMGADLHALVNQQSRPGAKRILSGSTLSGRESQFLSRYHLQASVVAEAPPQRHNWLLDSLSKAARPAPFIPTQALEQALGADLPIVPLLRALSIGDAESAMRLGCLQLGEDDLALATYVTGGGTNFGQCLRNVLNILEEDA
jgi:Na+-transporting NADH:ubiquinone oxidoreductase subunit A